MATTYTTVPRGHLTVFEGRESLRESDRRTNPRLRAICDEHLQGMVLGAPRALLEGRYRPSEDRDPIAAGSLGLVICRRILRDGPDWPELFGWCARTLAAGGILYLSAPDARALVDPDYGLPGLSQAPLTLAEIYLSLTFNHGSPLYRPLERRLVYKLAGQFEVYDYSKRYITGTKAPPAGQLEFCLIKTGHA